MESQAEIAAVERAVERSLRERNKLNKTWQPAVIVEPATHPGRAVDHGDPLDEGDGASMLPDKRDATFMDAVLHRLYTGEGYIKILDMSECSLMDHQVPRLADAIGDSATLQTLSVGGNRLTHLSMPDFASGIHKCNSITALDLSGNNIGKKGAADLAKILRLKKNLTALDVSCNLLSDYGVLAILEALCSVPNVPIKRLSISENGISDHSCAGISTILDEAKSLELLDISRSSFHAGGIRIMSDELVTHMSLRHLSLAHVTLCDECMEPLAAAVRRNVSLRTLDLYSCGFGDTGATSMAVAIASNKYLEILDIGSNQIHAEGCQVIADSLATNTSLTILKMWGNELREGVTRLEAAMMMNDRITALDITGSRGPDVAISVIRSLVRKNRNAQAGLLRDQIELRTLRADNLKLKNELDEKEKDLQRQAANPFSFAGKQVIGAAAVVADASGDLKHRAHLDDLDDGVSHGVRNAAGGFAEALNPNFKSKDDVRPDSFAGAYGGGASGDWWQAQFGNLTSSLGQLPATINTGFFNANPNTRPANGHTRNEGAEANVWGGV